MDKKTENIKNNLMNQVTKLYKETNRGSFKTRARYEEATERFCNFLAKEFRLQKFKNVKEKHVVAYVEHMKTEGKAPSTIQTDLSAIRFSHSLSGSRNILPDNSKLNLEQREYNKIDRAWTQKEIDQAKQYAQAMDRPDVYHAIDLSEKFGLRIEGAATVTVNHLKEALETKELYAKEKGGLERYIPVKTVEQENTIKNLLNYAQKNGKTGSDKAISSSVKHGVKQQIKSIQNWVTNNRDKFQDNSIRGKENVQEFRKTAEENGLKMRSENLSFHGLRYKYAQDRFETLKDQGFSDKVAKFTVSRELGHFRPDITNVYLARK